MIWEHMCSARPFVSVAVVIVNEAKHIRKCLDSLTNQDYPPDQREVLVVDGGSTDGTLQIVEEFVKRYPYIQLCMRPGCSYPGGLNIGLRAAKGEVWTFVDGHSVVPRDYLSKAVKCLNETGAAGVGGVLNSTGDGYVGAAIALALSTPFGAGNAKFRLASRYLRGAGYVDTVPFGVFRKEVLERVGGFDETRLRSADIDLSHRIRKLGGKFYLSPELRIDYYSRSTLRSMMRQAYANGYPLAKTLYVARARHFMPVIFLVSLLLCLILAPVFMAAKLALSAIIGAYLLLNLTFSFVIGAEHGARLVPVVTLIFPLLHLSYGAGSLIGLLREGGGAFRAMLVGGVRGLKSSARRQ